MYFFNLHFQFLILQLMVLALILCRCVGAKIFSKLHQFYIHQAFIAPILNHIPTKIKVRIFFISQYFIQVYYIIEFIYWELKPKPHLVQHHLHAKSKVHVHLIRILNTWIIWNMKNRLVSQEDCVMIFNWLDTATNM